MERRRGTGGSGKGGRNNYGGGAYSKGGSGGSSFGRTDHGKGNYGKGRDTAAENEAIGLGEFRELRITRKKEFGFYLIDDLTNKEFLLPIKEVPTGSSAETDAAPGAGEESRDKAGTAEPAIGQTIRVFLYLDSEDRPIATTVIPKLSMGKTAVLTVKQVTKIGAFLDWGLPKDLFLPYKEMSERVKEQDEVLVRLYLDRSNRLCASMKKLYPLLDRNSPYGIGDEVTGRIYEFGHDFGTFVAVDNRYSAMIPRHEDVSAYHIGDLVKAKVTFVKEDGKLDLTLREKAYVQIDKDAEKVLSILDSYGGVLPFTEAASPEIIKRETGLSKGAFKRAVGHLYKVRKISLENGTIRLKEVRS